MRANSARALLGALFLAAALSPVGAAWAQVRPGPSPTMEARIAAEQHADILRRFGGEYRDPELTAYVERVGQALVRVHGDGGYRFNFTVIDAADVFAFTQAGGYVYVSRGMIALANSEDELAAVLAHELVHVFSRHGAQREAMRRELGNLDLADADILYAFTRDQELEADALSIPILIAAGYDPFAQGRFLNLVRWHDEVSITNGTRRVRDESDITHPALIERAELATSMARELFVDMVPPSGPAGGFPGPGYLESGGDDYDPARIGDGSLMSVLDGIVFGPRPEAGYVNGNAYYDARRRIAFELPPGFHFTYAGRTITAEGPSGATMRFDSYTHRRTFNTDLVDYLGRVAGFRVQKETAQRLEINGLAGALARAVPAPGSTEPRLYLGVVQATSRTLFRFSFWLPHTVSDAVAESVWEAPLSFRRLTPQEARALQPLHLQVVTVEPGMTAESLGATMRMLNHPLEWFRMLNDLEPGEPLAPGRRVKVVVP